MKLHIECLQEKLDQIQKESELTKAENDQDMKKIIEIHENELKNL